MGPVMGPVMHQVMGPVTDQVPDRATDPDQVTAGQVTAGQGCRAGMPGAARTRHRRVAGAAAVARSGC